MANIPTSNLPAVSQPWARAIEEALAARDSEISTLRGQVSTLNGALETMSAHNTDLQNYIRTICQIAGYAYPPQATPPAPPAPTPDAPAAPKSKTIEVDAGWSATWYQGFKRTSVGGTNDDRNSLYQRGSGYTYSMWRFNVGEAYGKNITGVQMYLSNISTYYNGAFVAVLGTHGYEGEPGSRPANRENGFDVGWSAGEARWIDIPNWAYGGLSNGSIQGFTMGDRTAETRNFARFNGVGRAGAPRLRLTFNV